MKQQQTLQPKLRFPEFDGDWDYKPLGEFVSNKSKKFNPKNNEDNLKCVELEHIDQNTGRLLGFISSLDTNSTKNVFKKGEVLYGKLRPYLNKYYYCEFDGVCSSEIWVLSGNNFSNKLISQLTQTNYFKFVTLKTTGSKMPRADWNVLSETEFCVPLDIPEQQKIADYLSTVDTKINLLEEKKAQLALYKKAMMQKLFSQEIRFKDDNGNDFPEWEEKRLGEVFSGLKGQGLSKDSLLDEGENNCILYGELFTKYKEVIKSVISKTNTLSGVISKNGDILIPASTTTNAFDLANATALLVDNVILGGDINILRPKQKLSSEFYAYYLSNFKKYELGKLGQGITIVHLYYTHFKNIMIDLPSLSEQQKIANFLSSIDESIEKVNEQISQMQSFKKAMLQQMFV